MFSKKIKIYQQDSNTPLMHAKKQNKFLSFALLLNHPDIVPEIFDKYGVWFFFLIYSLVFFYLFNIYTIIRIQ